MAEGRRRSPVGRALRATSAVGLISLAIAVPTRPAVAAPSYSATAAAGGIIVTTYLPFVPLLTTPVDGGGPTAQVEADSNGTSKGYAAFPDPGSDIVGLPGLATGLLAQGVAGLPPIALPTLPGYPFSVTSDPFVAPEASLGSGPYTLRATSGPDATTASAAAGVQPFLLGGTASVTSDASITSSDDGVDIEATSDVRGIALGPLVIGAVTSTAGFDISPDGTATPTSSMQITGASIGGIGVILGADGLSVAGLAVPIPVAQLLEILEGVGITLEVLEGEQDADHVIAPSLRITLPFDLPFDVPQVGRVSGTVTMTLGQASASLNSGSVPTRTPPTTPPSEPVATDASPLAPSSSPPASGGSVARPSAPAAATTGPAVTPVATSSVGVPVRPVWDIVPLYLTIAAGVAASIANQFARRRSLR